MGAMADGTPSGWLPPRAPGAGPAPRFDGPQQPAPPAAQGPPPTGPTFVRPADARPGERNRAAIWALALGVAGLTLLVISFGSLFMLALPCSIAAWALGRRERRQIERGTTSHGEGQATAALWLGRIGVVAGVAAMVVFVALLASGFDFEQFRDDLERELEERENRPSGGVRAAVEGLRAAVGR
jgi:hypothetical protein